MPGDDTLGLPNLSARSVWAVAFTNPVHQLTGVSAPEAERALEAVNTLVVNAVAEEREIANSIRRGDEDPGFPGAVFLLGVWILS